MTTYQPQEVLPEYTDERLKSDQPGYSREIADLFLTIPAEYRQSVEAAATQATTRMVPVPGTDLQRVERTGNIHEYRRFAVAQCRAQLGLKS